MWESGKSRIPRGQLIRPYPALRFERTMLDYLRFADNSDMIGHEGQVVEHQNGIKPLCLAKPNMR